MAEKMYPFSLCGCIYTYVCSKEVTYVQASILIEDRGHSPVLYFPLLDKIWNEQESGYAAGTGESCL